MVHPLRLGDHGVYLDSGIELDLGTPDATYRAYYQELIDGVGSGNGIRQRHSGGKVGLAASHYKYDWVLTADYVTIFEGTAQVYVDDATYKAIGRTAPRGSAGVVVGESGQGRRHRGPELTG